MMSYKHDAAISYQNEIEDKAALTKTQMKELTGR